MANIFCYIFIHFFITIEWTFSQQIWFRGFQWSKNSFEFLIDHISFFYCQKYEQMKTVKNLVQNIDNPCFYWLTLYTKGVGLKGTVIVISNDPPCKDGNTRFTTEPLKALSNQVWINVYNIDNWIFSTVVSILKWIIRYNNFYTLKNDNIFHIIDQIKVSRVHICTTVAWSKLSFVFNLRDRNNLKNWRGSTQTEIYFQ